MTGQKKEGVYIVKMVSSLGLFIRLPKREVEANGMRVLYTTKQAGSLLVTVAL